jgi:hypothetical protein
MPNPEFLRRKQAAEYLNNKYSHCSWRTLARLAVSGGGPAFRKCGRMVLYAPADLDEWALSRISVRQNSTTDRQSL